jgi:hypothetical protein
VIADHHGHFDSSASALELIENNLVCPYDVIELLDTLHDSCFPEPERVTDNEQLGIPGFAFQLLQKANEFGRVVAMLQAAITAHVQVADKK